MTKKTYFFTEVDQWNDLEYSKMAPQELVVTTLEDAKRAASNLKVHYHTWLKVGVGLEGVCLKWVAIKAPNDNKWYEL